MFEYKYLVPKNDINTTFGSVCIKNIIFEPSEIEKKLPDIVLNDDNLKHMFAEDNLNSFNRQNIYKRFIPREKLKVKLDDYVEEKLKQNVNFYSFLAEGILSLIFRDLHNFELAKGVIDVTETLADTHTGVDACMYNIERQIIVLGEAKFYEKLNKGINKIIDDFAHKNIKNKIESLQRATENCENTSRIVIKNLKHGNYNEFSIEDFMNQKIVFAGFVLHSENDISKYENKNFYDNYKISAEMLNKNICSVLDIDLMKGDYEIILVHLPVESKKKLIIKMIQSAQNMLKDTQE